MTTFLDDKSKKRNVACLYSENNRDSKLQSDFTSFEYGKSSYSLHSMSDIDLNSKFRSGDLRSLQSRNSKGSPGSPQCSVVSVEDQAHISKLPASMMKVSHPNNSYESSQPPSSSSFPGLNKSKWSRAEHEAFLKGLRTHGKDWKLVSSVVETRTPLETQIHADEFFLKTSRMTCMGGTKRGSSSALNRLVSNDTSDTRRSTTTVRRDTISSQESRISLSPVPPQPEKICWDKIVFAPSSTPVPAQQKHQPTALKQQASLARQTNYAPSMSSQSASKQPTVVSSPVKSAPAESDSASQKRLKTFDPSAGTTTTATPFPYSFEAIMQMINSPLFAALLAQYPQLASMMAATVVGDAGKQKDASGSNTSSNSSNNSSSSSSNISNVVGRESGITVLGPAAHRPISTASSILPLGQVSSDPYFRHMYPLSVPPMSMAQAVQAPVATPAMPTALCGNPLLDMPYVPASKLTKAGTTLSAPNTTRSNMSISTAFRPDIGGMYSAVPPTSNSSQQRGVSKVTPLSSSASSSAGAPKVISKRQTSPPPRPTVGVLNHRYEEELLAAQMLSNLCSTPSVSTSSSSNESAAPATSVPATSSAGAPARIIPIGSVFASSLLLPSVAGGIKDSSNSSTMIATGITTEPAQPAPVVTVPPTSTPHLTSATEPAHTEPTASEVVSSVSANSKAAENAADTASVSHSISETTPGGVGGGAGSKSKKYRHLTLADKYEIVQKVRYYDLEARSAKSVCNMHQAVARDYGVCESTVYQIVRRQDDIERKYFEQVQTGVVDGEQHAKLGDKNKDANDDASATQGSSNNDSSKEKKKSGRKPGRFLSSPVAKELPVGRE